MFTRGKGEQKRDGRYSVHVYNHGTHHVKKPRYVQQDQNLSNGRRQELLPAESAGPLVAKFVNNNNYLLLKIEESHIIIVTCITWENPSQSTVHVYCLYGIDTGALLSL